MSTPSFPFKLPRPLVADFIAPGTIASGTTVHEPTLNFTVIIPHLDAAPVVLAPEPYITVPVPLLGPGTTVHEPTVASTYSIVLPSINVGYEVGTSIGFTGGTEQISIGDVDNMHGDITVEMWIQPFSLDVRMNPIQKLYWGEFAITVNVGGGISMYQGEGTGTSDWEGWSAVGQPLSIGEWTHLVYTREGQDARLYINGSLNAGPYTFTKVAVNTASPVIIGDGYTDGWDGLIDDVALYTSALTSTQVSDHYNAKLQGDYDAEVSSDSPEAWLKLNESSGSSFTDSSGNSWTGTLTGTVDYSQTPHTSAEQVYEPTLALSYTTFVPLLDAGPALFNHTITRTGVSVEVPHLDASPTIHEPTVAKGAVTVTPPDIDASPTLYEPTLATTVDVPIPAIASTVTLFAPSVKQNVHTPIINVGSVYEPTVAATVDVPMQTLGAGPTVHEPTIDPTFTVLPNHIGSTLIVHEPTVIPDQFVTVGLLDSSVTVFAPDLDLALFVPSLDASATLHEPTQKSTYYVGDRYLDMTDDEYSTQVWADEINLLNSTAAHSYVALGWESAYQATNIQQVAVTGAFGGYVTEWESTGAGQIQPLNNQQWAVSEGDTVRQFIKIRQTVAVGGTPVTDYRMSGQWLDSNEDHLAWTTQQTPGGGTMDLTGGGWEEGYFTHTAPANAAWFRWDSGYYLIESGDKFQIDTAGLYINSTKTTFVPSTRVEGELYVEARLRLDDWSSAETSYQQILHRFGGGNNGYVLYMTSGAGILLGTYDGGFDHVLEDGAANTLVDGEEYIIAGWVDPSSGDYAFYQDGNEVASGTDTPNPWTIGYSTPVRTTVARDIKGGHIYWVRVYDGDTSGPIVIEFNADDIPVGVVEDGYTWTDSLGHDWEANVVTALAVDYAMPRINASATFYEPTLATTATITVPAIPSGHIVHEPTVAKAAYPITPPVIVNTTTVHEPTVAPQEVTVTPDVINIGTIHEPTLNHALTIPHIPATTVVHEPAQVWLRIFIDHLDSTIAVFEPAASTTAFPPLIDASPTLYDPTLTTTVTRVIDQTIDASPTVHQPQIAVAVKVPLLANGLTVHQPTALKADYIISPPFLNVGPAIYNPGVDKSGQIAPPTLLVGTIHEPTITTGQVEVSPALLTPTPVLHEPTVATTFASAIPSIPAGTQLHEPTIAITVRVPHIAATTAVYEPTSSSTVHMPLLDASALLHDPTVAATIDAPIGHIPSTVAVYEPNLVTVISPATLSIGVVHEPVAFSTITVTVPTIAATTQVFEPTLTLPVYPVAVPNIDASPTLHEFQVNKNIDVPLLSVGVVHTPGTDTAGTVSPEWIDAAPTVHQPTVATTYEVRPGVISAGPQVHEPTLNLRIFIPLLDASPFIFEVKTITTVHTQLIPSTVVVYAPNVEKSYTISLSPVPGSATVYEPIAGFFSVVSPNTLSVPQTLHEPTVVPQGVSVVVPLLDIPITVHEPRSQTEIDVPHIDATISVSEPSVYQRVRMPHIDASIAVFDPQADASYTIVVEPLTGVATVHQPSLDNFEEVFVDHIDVSAQVFEPSVSASYAVTVPTIYPTTVYQPQVIAEGTFVVVPILNAGPTIHAPEVLYVVFVPHIAAPITVHTPNAYAYKTVEVPHLDGIATIHEPTLFRGVKLIKLPLVALNIQVYEPRMQGGITIPTLPGGTVVYGPKVTLEAALEIIGFNVGIRQDKEADVGLRTDLSQSLLLKNKV